MNRRVVFASIACGVLVVGGLALVVVRMINQDGLGLPPPWVVGLLVALAVSDFLLNTTLNRQQQTSVGLTPPSATVSAQQPQVHLLLRLALCNSLLLIAGVLAIRLDRPTTYLIGVALALATLALGSQGSIVAPLERDNPGSRRRSLPR